MIIPSLLLAKINNLLSAIERELESAIDWFIIDWIAHPDKFQAIIMNKRRENQITNKLNIYNNEIETTNSVKLLCIEIDNLDRSLFQIFQLYFLRKV